MEVLRTILASGEEALPVFSFEDEARMFLELGHRTAGESGKRRQGSSSQFCLARARASVGSHWTRYRVRTPPRWPAS